MMFSRKRSSSNPLSPARRVKYARTRPMLPVVRNRIPRAFRLKGPISPSGLKELKYVDTAQTNYACDTTGNVTALNLIAVGDDNTNRDGRQVTIKSVQLHGILYPVDGTTSATKCRVMLVWDNAVSGALPAIGTILTTANGTTFPLVDNANRFTILVDRTYSLGVVTNVATQAYAMGPGAIDVEIYRRINSMTQYSGTTAAIASIQNGGLYLVCVGSSAANDGGTLQASVRVRFSDD